MKEKYALSVGTTSILLLGLVMATTPVFAQVAPQGSWLDEIVFFARTRGLLILVRQKSQKVLNQLKEIIRIANH